MYCYLLRSETHNITYVGITGNINKRIRQHNGELKGGAKFTRSFGGGLWRVYLVVGGFKTRGEALKFEYKVKHMRGCCGVEGKVRAVEKVLEEGLEVWVEDGIIIEGVEVKNLSELLG